MPKELFGTDGIRGVPGTPPLDDATLFATGRSLAAYLLRKHSAAHVLIGMDTRESGPHIAALLAAGLAQAGASVAFAGIITTPGVACLVRQNDFQAGVVISASHNPYHDNGVKLFSHAGMKFPDSVEEILEADIFKHRSDPPPKNPPLLVADASLDAEYLDFLRSRVIPGAKLSGFRIVLDCANGAAYKLGPELFHSLGAKVVSMGVSPDGRNINAGCGSLHLDGLQKRMLSERAQLGVAFDGDADRALFVCETGKIINGDGVLLAVARHLKSQNKLKGDRVVATSMSNLGLERVLAREGITLARASVGDRYVLEEMLRSGNVIGGEQSGHVIFHQYATTGDGMLTALRVFEAMRASGTGLDELTSELQVYPQRLVNVRVRERKPIEELPGVKAAIRDAEKSFGDTGRVLVRFSGTEPLARVMVEGPDLERVEKFANHIASEIRAELGAE